MNHRKLGIGLALLAGLLLSISTVGLGAEKPSKPGSVEGVITYRGKVPKARVADEVGHRHNLLDVDRKTRGLRWAVVFLIPKDVKVGNKQASQIPRKPAVIDQQEHMFVPHMIAVRAGQTVKFTNADAANHNVRGSSLVAKNNFNIFTGAGGKYEHRFASDRKNRPVALTCDIHPWMRAWVYVFDHPHFTVTDKKGKFRLADVPPGQYQMIVRQPDVGFTSVKEVTITSDKTLRTTLEIDGKQLKTD